LQQYPVRIINSYLVFSRSQSDMNHKLQALTTDELIQLLNQERKKFIVAIDYGASGSDLQEIRDHIKELESIIASRNSKENSRKSENRQSFAN
jgi:uncharacterized UPF0160 family protein